MPFVKSRYPANWKEISERIRKRDGNRCRHCGVKNYQLFMLKACFGGHGVQRYRVNLVGAATYKEALVNKKSWAPPGALKLRIVVLTVAHLNHNTKDNRGVNLAALCQACHNAHDSKHRSKNRAATRDKKRGQKVFFAGANA